MTIERVPLGTYVKVAGGFAFKSEDFSDEGIPVVRISDLQNGSLTLDNVARIPKARVGKGENYRVGPGDILIAMSGATTGKIGLAPTELEGPLLQNQRVGNFKIIDNSKIDKRYLRHFVSSPSYQGQVWNNMVGVAQPNVSSKQLESFELLLPPLAEQRRIAEVLDKAEALRAKRRAALAKLDSITQSLFLDLFGDLAKNPKGWSLVPFAELGENQDSQRVPVKSSDRDGRKGEYPYYGASGIIDWVDDYIFDGERLLIGEDGANLVARATPVAYIARGKYWVNNHAHVIADNGRADLRFLEFFIEQLDLKPFISGTAQPKLNRSNLDRISVPLPPHPLQREFARRVRAVEKLKAAQRASLAEMDALFATLQHRAFRGEL